MKYKVHILCFLLAYACPPTNAAFAEDTEEKSLSAPINEVEVGIIYNSEDSFKFGEYTGLQEEGFYLNGKFLVRSPSAYDDDSTEYYEATGTNLGLDSRSLSGVYGELGKYSIHVDYDQLPRFQYDDAFSFFGGAGSSVQTLPAGWVTTTNSPQILAATNATFPSSTQVDVETERKKFGGGLSWTPSEFWKITADYHHEVKDGTGTLGATTSTGGGGPSSVLVSPVNYNVDDLNIGMSYADMEKQLAFKYNLSFFRNDDSNVTWQNPFTTGSTTARIGQDPDNQAHHVNLSGGYNLGLTSRVSGTVSYSRLLQNDTYVPYTTDPTLLTVDPLPPRADLDGKVDKWYANLKFSSRPMRGLNVGASFTYDDYDNRTPRDLYNRVVNDNRAQDAASASQNNVNRPYSVETTQFDLDVGYRLTMKTKLSAGFEFERKERDFSEVETTDDVTGKIKLSSNLHMTTNGWIEYSYSNRDNSSYNPSVPFIEGTDPALLPPGCSSPPFTGCVTNDVLLRKYYMADRVQNKLVGSLVSMPTDLVSVGFTGQYLNDNYNDTVVGLQDYTSYYATVDVGYNPRKNVDIYAYYTHEYFDVDQAGRISGGENDWLYDTKDRVNTLGVGMKWSNINGKYDVAADYTFSLAETEIDPTNLPVDTAVNFPDINTFVHSLRLRGDYHFKENVVMRLQYQLEYYDTDDWALDGMGQADINRVIWLGYGSPDYTAHVVGFSLIYTFE